MLTKRVIACGEASATKYEGVANTTCGRMWLPFDYISTNADHNAQHGRSIRTAISFFSVVGSRSGFLGILPGREVAQIRI